jgi:hypothetical protein
MIGFDLDFFFFFFLVISAAVVMILKLLKPNGKTSQSSCTDLERNWLCSYKSS